MSNEILHINEVRYLRDYILYIEFDNGEKKAVDVSPLLTGPVFEPLHNKNLFLKVTIDPISKTIVWPNGADLAPEALLALKAVECVA